MSSARDLIKTMGAARRRGVRRFAVAGNEDGTVASGTPGLIYVRVPKGDGTFTVGVARSAASYAPGIPLELEIDPLTVSEANRRGEYRVAGVDSVALGVAIVSGGYTGDPGVFTMPLHAVTHEYGGNDQVGLNTNQLVQLRAEPDEDNLHGVTVRAGYFVYHGVARFKTANEDVDLSGYYPASGSKFVWLVIGPASTSVSVVDNGDRTYTALASAFPVNQGYVLALVMLTAEEAVSWGNIIDMRFAGDRLMHILSYPEDTSPDPDADYVVTWDASASAHKRVLLDNAVAPHLLADESGLGPKHTMAGVTVGYVLTAISDTDAAFRPATGGGGSAVGTGATIPTPHWVADGHIAVLDEVDGCWKMAYALTVNRVWMYLRDTGTASSTIVDVDVSTDQGATWTTLFTDPADRPELAANAGAPGEAFGYLSVTLTPGSILRMNIEQIGTGAEDLSVQLEGTYENSAVDYNLLPVGILPMGVA